MANFLSQRQEAFCVEFIRCNSTKEAMIKAGYTSAYARIHAEDMMANKLVKARIKELMNEFNAEKIADAEEVMRFLSAGMRGEMVEEVVSNNRGKATAVKKAMDIKDRIRCAELLAKKYKMLSDRVEVTGDITQQVVFVGGDELPDDTLIDEPIECPLLEDVIEVQYEEEIGE